MRRPLLAWAALVLTLMCAFAPWLPGYPDTNLDPSWQYAMNEAVARGLVFGRDMIFTYGPYASVFTRMYHPATDSLAMVGALYLALSYAVCVATAMPDASRARLLALCGVIGMLLMARDTLLQSYGLVAGLALARWLQPVADEPHAPLLRVALVMAPVGLLAQVKGSAGILGAAVAVLAVPALWWRGYRAHALVAVASPLFGLGLFWWLIGQPLEGLPAYLANLWPIVSGYSEAMAYGGFIGHVLAYLLAAAALCAWMWWQLAGQGLRRAYLLALFALCLFMAFKAGFVRNDSHAVLAAYTLPVALVLMPLPTPWRRLLPLLLLCLLCWGSITYQYISHALHQVVVLSVVDTYANAAQGLRWRLLDRGAFRFQFDRRKAALRALAGLPRVQGTTDIYPVNQTDVLASDLDWSPRPVMQSYSAYTPALAEANRAHLLGARAPQNIFFAVDPIDERLPALEDGPSWPVLLAAYRPVSVHEGLLRLQRLEAPRADSPLPVTDTLSGRLGQPLAVPASEQLLFVRADLRLTLLGRALGLLFKTPMLLVHTETVTGKKATWRLVSGMARAGFVLSPLVETTADFARLYADPARSAHQRVARITIQPGWGAGWIWQTAFAVQLSTLPPPASPVDDRALGISHAPVAMPAGVLEAKAADCEGSIDRINRTQPLPTSASARAPLVVEGWLSASVRDPKPTGDVFLMVTDAQGARHFMPMRKRPRDDLAKHFGRPELAAAGFHGDADVSSLPGRVWLGLALQRDGELRLCKNISIPFEIKGP